MVRTVLIWDRVQQPRLAIYCWGLHVGGFVSAVLGVGWCLGLAVLFFACFLYIAALCLCKMPPLHADCHLSCKPAAVIQFAEKNRAQWNPDKQKYGRPASLVQEKVMFATVKIHVVPSSPRACQTDIFLQPCCLKTGFSSLHEVPAGTAHRLNKPRARHCEASMWHLAAWHL